MPTTYTLFALMDSTQYVGMITICLFVCPPSNTPATPLVLRAQVPTVSLNDMGPSYDLVVRRSQLPSGDMWKAAIQKDKRYALKIPRVLLLMSHCSLLTAACEKLDKPD